MPWSVVDVDSHMKGLSPKAKRAWVHVANSALARCQADHGENCDARAIRQANAAARRVNEADALEALLVDEKGRVLSARSEGEIRSAIAHLNTLLAQLMDLPGDGEEAGEGPGEDVHAEIEAAVARILAEHLPVPDPPPARARAHRDAHDEALELTGDLIPLVEQAVRGDGTIPLKIISPGWGSSGYYSAAVLARDGPAAFPRGTHMYWDHPTARDDQQRPERSLRDLAAVLVTDPTWHPSGDPRARSGPGLYADAKVFGDYARAVDELAPHIGVSIRSLGRGQEGEAEGRTGRVISELSQGLSVDFVTAPGRGGEILQAFESARVSRGASGGASGGRDPGEPSSRGKESAVTDDEARALREAHDRMREEVAALREREVLREARDQVNEQIASARLPELTRARLRESLCLSAPTKDGALDREAFAARIDEAVTAATAEVAAILEASGGGRIMGMGSPRAAELEPYDPAKFQDTVAAKYQALGMSEAAAKAAAAGR